MKHDHVWTPYVGIDVSPSAARVVQVCACGLTKLNVRGGEIVSRMEISSEPSPGPSKAVPFSEELFDEDGDLEPPAVEP